MSTHAAAARLVTILATSSLWIAPCRNEKRQKPHGCVAQHTQLCTRAMAQEHKQLPRACSPRRVIGGRARRVCLAFLSWTRA
jgi:hypothetical protein